MAERGYGSAEGEGITLGVLAALVIAYPAHVPDSWRATDRPAWYREALCIHAHEGAWNAETGNGYSGGFQFLATTWRGVGGLGMASAATPREQLFRAWLVFRRDGNSWREWGTARACGLT